MAGKMATLMAAVIGVGLLAGMFVRPLLVPWMLSAAIFIVNYGLSLLFLQSMGRLKAGAAAGVAVLSFLIRFGLIGMGLLLVALALPVYFMATALCFLVVYTVFVGLEVIVGLKYRDRDGRTASAGGKM